MRDADTGVCEEVRPLHECRVDSTQNEVEKRESEYTPLQKSKDTNPIMYGWPS